MLYLHIRRSHDEQPKPHGKKDVNKPMLRMRIAKLVRSEQRKAQTATPDPLSRQPPSGSTSLGEQPSDVRMLPASLHKPTKI